MASLAIVGTLLGALALMFGRQYYALLLGLIVAVVTAYFLAILNGLEGEFALITSGEWLSLLLAIGAGVIGYFVGRYDRDIAITIIGFLTGTYLATLLDEVILHLTGRESPLTWWLLAIFLASGLLGAYAIRRNPDELLILLSVTLGISLIDSSVAVLAGSILRAILLLSLALVGVVYQYAAYIRENPMRRTVLPAVPSPISEDLPFE